MPPTSPAGEEVVEKRASAPVSTACLIIACAALLGGIVFQVLEIAEYRSGPGDPKDQASKKYKADVKKLDEQVEEILSKAASGPGAPTDPAPGTAAEPGAETPATPPADSAEGGETPAEPPAPAAAPGDTKAPAPADEGGGEQ